MSFKIIVDSCCDLSPSTLRDGSFVQVPLTIRVQDHVIVDDSTFDQASLLALMRGSPEAPQTSCPSPADFMDAFDCGADDIYVVTLSALLSGSHNSAEQARKLFLEDHPNVNIHVFNSCSASCGEVLLALVIKDWANKGLAFQQVVSKGTQFIQDSSTLFVLETLDNLRKNGRLTKLQSVVTSALQIKLFMYVTPEGELHKLGQAISNKQALSKMVAHVAKDPNHVGKILAMTHCNCLERAYQLRSMLEKSCQFSEYILVEAGGISTVYANDGGLIISY